jgi:predicted HTH transcriptional regulator
MTSINLEYIQSLIDNEIKESLNLDYKRELNNNKEIAKDVSSFANTNSGKIIYGVDEKDGLPNSINWIDSKDVKEKIECVILDHIQPEIKGFNIYSIENPENRSQAIFVVDIPESSDAPHMANHRYYIRRNFKSEYMEDYEVK